MQLAVSSLQVLAGSPAPACTRPVHRPVLGCQSVAHRPSGKAFVFPIKLYGILAAGRPLVFIGDREGEISLLVEREGIGVAVRQGDAAGLADRLVQLAGDAVLREAMGTRARALLCERYDKRIAFKAWLELLGGAVTAACGAFWRRSRLARSFEAPLFPGQRYPAYPLLLAPEVVLRSSGARALRKSE